MELYKFVRRLDDLGRIVLPYDCRKYINIVSGEYINIERENGKLILSRAIPENDCKFEWTEESE